MLTSLGGEISPVAEDRGGIPEDFDNYVNLLRRLRERLNSTGKKYGISLAIVSDKFLSLP